MFIIKIILVTVLLAGFLFAQESTMEFNGTSTTQGSVTATFSTGAFNSSSDGTAMDLYSGHPYAHPINGGNDYSDITISPATYIVKVTVAWGVNVQGFVLQFYNGGSPVKEISGFNSSGNIMSPTDFNVGVVADAIRFYDTGSSSSGGFELSHLTFNTTLPVELTAFTASLNGNVVKLKWKTETEINNYGFYIERSADNITWSIIGFVEGNGNSNSPKNYKYEDGNIQAGDYYYRLKQVDTDGNFEYSKVVEINTANTSYTFALNQNYPNPFNPETIIKYEVSSYSQTKILVTLKVFNVLGSEIATLVNEEKPAGKYEVKFDGSTLPSGIYFYRINTESYVATKKMNLVK